MYNICCLFVLLELFTDNVNIICVSVMTPISSIPERGYLPYLFVDC